MKYTYAYKTSDGRRHEASTEAASREDVFESLRRQGIRPIKVVAADGSKSNGEVRGVRKRVLILSVAAAACLAAILVYGVLHLSHGPSVAIGDERRPDGESHAASPLPRQIVYGDRSRIGSIASVALTNRVNSFLVRFAEPGRPFAAPEADWPTKDEFLEAFRTPITIADGELTEYIDLKRIIVGLKHEMQAYLNAGGTVEDFIAELVRRQAQEIAQREKAQKHLDGLLDAACRAGHADGRSDNAALASAYDYWVKANAQLQSMGIYPLPLPDRLREYQLTVDIGE